MIARSVFVAAALTAFAAASAQAQGYPPYGGAQQPYPPRDTAQPYPPRAPAPSAMPDQDDDDDLPPQYRAPPGAYPPPPGYRGPYAYEPVQPQPGYRGPPGYDPRPPADVPVERSDLPPPGAGRPYGTPQGPTVIYGDRTPPYGAPAPYGAPPQQPYAPPPVANQQPGGPLPLGAAPDAPPSPPGYITQPYGAPPPRDAATGTVRPNSVATLPPDEQPESGKAELPPNLRRQMVPYATNEPAGTLIIDTGNTYLYLVMGNGQAMRYGIGVGREGFTWAGAERISKMKEWPDWFPPAEMIERQPYLPRMMAGGETNPLGARALYLGKTLYRIHGTNQPSTIGKYVSSGCIRLTNDDIQDLYSRVQVGTRVVVLPGSAPATAQNNASAPALPPLPPVERR